MDPLSSRYCSGPGFLWSSYWRRLQASKRPPDEYRAFRTTLMAWRTDTSKLDVIPISLAILTEEKSIRPLDTSLIVSTPSPFAHAHVAHSLAGPTPPINGPLPPLSIHTQLAPSQSPSYPPRRFERRRDPCALTGHLYTYTPMSLGRQTSD